MKKDYLKSIVVLTAICLVIAAVMAGVNSLTSPIIDEANAKAEREALMAVLPGAADFESVELSKEISEKYPSVSAIYADTANAGYAVMLKAKGYDGSNPMSIAVGVDAGGNIIKCQVISCSGETTGIGTKVSGEDFLEQFAGADASLEGVDSISGATISSKGFIGAVKEALEAVKAVSAK